jgi:hypothetical protein
MDKINTIKKKGTHLEMKKSVDWSDEEKPVKTMVSLLR